MGAKQGDGDSGSGSTAGVEARHAALRDRLIRVAVEARLFGKARKQVKVGRYVVERPLDAGGMGSVYLARDPQLDRPVAIKLLSAGLENDEQMRRRVVREARAMAKLSDPHVAVVFEVGESDGVVFVAMEYLPGPNLRSWLAQEDHEPGAIIALFVQAGRGLAAAHDKGLVHRDFKPDNVVIDEAGRAKVIDFGLARSKEDPLRGTLDPESHPPASGISEQTMTGALAGTPAYMAPEQWLGADADARTDQYSFCVALAEALTGHRPKPIRSTDEAEKAEPAAWTTGVDVPRHVAEAVARGLATNPDKRFASMQELLLALQPAAPRRGRTLIAVAGVAIAVTATTFALTRGGARSCEVRAPALPRPWNDDARVAMRAAFGQTAIVYAQPVADATVAALDDWTASYAAASEDVCNAEGSDVAAACLGQAAAAFSDLVDELDDPGASGVAGALDWVHSLPPPESCLDPQRRPLLALEVSSEARAALYEARRLSASLQTPAATEDMPRRIERGIAASRRAAELATESDPAFIAAAHLIEGHLYLREGDKAESERSLRRAVELAESAGDVRTRVKATIELVYVVGSDRDRTVEALTLADQAQGALESFAAPVTWRAGLLSHRASVVAHARGTEPVEEDAVALQQHALALLEDLLGLDHPATIGAAINVGVYASYGKQPELARTILREALPRADATWGPEHPLTGRLRGTLGMAELRGGNADEAARLLTESLEVRRRALGDDHQQVASARYNLAQAQIRQDDWAGAAAQLAAGVEIRESLVGPEDPSLIPWLYAIGDVEVKRGRFTEARAILERALSLCEFDGAPPRDFARIRFALARATVAHDPAAARVLARSARATFEREGYTTAASEVAEFLETLAP